ncbi:DNA-directed DNA polymerase [Tanacetum coccineum]
MGKSSRNKKRVLEGFQIYYPNEGPSGSRGELMTQEEVDKEKLAISIYEQKEAIKRAKGEALIEKEDPGAFIFPIRLEGKINLNGVADTGSEVNVMPYRICIDLGCEKEKKVNRGIEMINHSLAEPMGLLKDVLCQVGVTTIIAKFLILDIPIDRDHKLW